MSSPKFKSIFSPATEQQREDNFADYWQFSQQHGGSLLEQDQDLSKKRERLRYFQDNPVRLRTPLANPEAFYRNYVNVTDDLSTLDRRTLLLGAIYKFARHEWVGIKGAWDAVPDMAHSVKVEDKISRFHLAEEFCHVRLFDEMLKTCGLDEVQWMPLSPLKEWVYTLFPRLPDVLLDAPAFVTELMGVTFYCHLYELFDDIFADEPEVRDRLKELLDEITIDEVAHVGQRRNFLGNRSTQISRYLVKPFFTQFFRDIPEVAHLFDVPRMIKDGLEFDFNQLPEAIIEKSWTPSYCQM